MAAPADRAQGANQVDRALMEAYLARTRAEVAELERRGLLLAGSAFPEVLLVKGVPGPAEQAGRTPLSGMDGDALRAALARLGYAEDAWAGLATFVREGPSWLSASAGDVTLAVETLDPELVVALDAAAARALQTAWVLEEPLHVGEVTHVRGRRVLSLGGFEAALADPDAKRAMWARLKQVPPLGSPL